MCDAEIVCESGRTRLVLGLGLWRLEGAGEDGESDVFQLLRHLGVAEILVQHDTVHQLCVLQFAPNLAVHLSGRQGFPSG